MQPSSRRALVITSFHLPRKISIRCCSFSLSVMNIHLSVHPRTKCDLPLSSRLFYHRASGIRTQYLISASRFITNNSGFVKFCLVLAPHLQSINNSRPISRHAPANQMQCYATQTHIYPNNSPMHQQRHLIQQTRLLSVPCLVLEVCSSQIPRRFRHHLREVVRDQHLTISSQHPSTYQP